MSLSLQSCCLETLIGLAHSHALLPFAADGLVDTPYAQSPIQGDESFRSSPAARIPTNAEAQRTTVTSAATHACRVSLLPTLSDFPLLKNAPLASYGLPGGRDRPHWRSATPVAPVRFVLPYP
jgi:hypothetical protein